MKNFLECIWIVVQIFAVFIGGYWTYDTWVKKDESALTPSVTATVTPIKSYWGNNQKDVCMISLLWTLNNNSEHPVNISNIAFELFYLKNDYEYSFKEKISDYSSDALVKVDNKKDFGLSAGNFKLKKSSDIISGKSKIDRDIAVAFRPSNNTDNINWFSTHRVMGVVSAKYSSSNSSHSGTSIFKTALQPTCYQD